MRYREVNKSVNRVDAYEKVTGKAKFAADLLFPDMLHAKVLRSRYPTCFMLKFYAVDILMQKLIR